MALTFPLSTSQFFDSLPIRAVSWSLSTSQQISRTGEGSFITADLGARYWRASITLVKMRHQQAEGIRSMLSVLAGSGSSFLAYPPVAKYPAHDPAGAIAAASTPTLHTISANRRDIRVTGLPAGYTLRAGEFIAFQYSTAPTRYALHQIVATTVVASGAGLTPLFEVIPAIRAGAAGGNSVQVLKPSAKFILSGNTLGTGVSDRIFTNDLSFDMMQTLR